MLKENPRGIDFLQELAIYIIASLHSPTVYIPNHYA